MNLDISRDNKPSQGGCFGASERYILKARLNASPEETAKIERHNIGILKISSFESGYQKTQDVYIHNLLNKDWQFEFWRMEVCARVQQEIIEGCKQAKARLEFTDNTGSKNIEL